MLADVYLLNTCCMPGILLGIWGAGQNETGKANDNIISTSGVRKLEGKRCGEKRRVGTAKLSRAGAGMGA